jgi:hypothetical protein
MLNAKRSWFVALPPDVPDINPIKNIRAINRTNGVHSLIFAKRKAHLRRPYRGNWKCYSLFLPNECLNYIAQARYVEDKNKVL